MPRPLVVPTRFGISSRIALTHAMCLSRTYGLAVVALHVLDPNDRAVPSHEAAERALDDVLFALGRPRGVTSKVEAGDTVPVLMTASVAASAIVLGLGYGGELGSVREHLLCHSRCPIVLATAAPDLWSSVN